MELVNQFVDIQADRKKKTAFDWATANREGAQITVMLGDQVIGEMQSISMNVERSGPNRNGRIYETGAMRSSLEASGTLQAQDLDSLRDTILNASGVPSYLIGHVHNEVRQPQPIRSSEEFTQTFGEPSNPLGSQRLLFQSGSEISVGPSGSVIRGATANQMYYVSDEMPEDAVDLSIEVIQSRLEQERRLIERQEAIQEYDVYGELQNQILAEAARVMERRMLESMGVSFSIDENGNEEAHYLTTMELLEERPERDPVDWVYNDPHGVHEVASGVFTQRNLIPSRAVEHLNNQLSRPPDRRESYGTRSSILTDIRR